MNITREPVRLYLYSMLGPVIGLLISNGIVGESQASLWIALGTAILGVGATEVARSKVTPVAS